MSELKSIYGKFATGEKVFTGRVYFDELGIIQKIEENDLGNNSLDFYHFNQDCVIFPAFGDIHIHAREDMSQKNIYKEDFNSCCNAAINGGVSHIGDMPNNPIPPIDDKSYSEKVLLAQNTKIPILMYAGIGPKTEPLSFKVPYKAFMGPSIGDLFFKSNNELEAAILKYRDQWVSFHCEDPVVLEKNKDQLGHFNKRPIDAEILATDFALYLIEKYNLKGKLCHYSSGDGLNKIIEAKKRGINVTCEVTPQHLYFCEEEIIENFKNSEILFQMNPPIRKKIDQERLIKGLINLDIDYLATDHAPHSQAEKEKGTSGMPGLDTYGLVITWLIKKHQIPLTTIAKIAAENPGNFFNEFYRELKIKFPHYDKWGKGLGKIELGYSASFSVLNFNKETIFHSNMQKSKAHWCPFEGVKFPGSIEALILGGKIQK